MTPSPPSEISLRSRNISASWHDTTTQLNPLSLSPTPLHCSLSVVCVCVCVCVWVQVMLPTVVSHGKPVKRNPVACVRLYLLNAPVLCECVSWPFSVYPQINNYAPFKMTFNLWQKSSTVTPHWLLWNVQFWSITLFLFKLFAHLLCLVYYYLLVFFTAALRLFPLSASWY